jgi:hypothetical protein
LVQATGEEVSVADAPAILAYTHVPWRNAVKYQARAYRHAFWDSGTILSHSLAVASAHEFPAKVMLGFVDRAVSELLSLDDQEELPIALLPMGFDPSGVGQEAPELEALDLQVKEVSKGRKEFPAIQEMHAASSLQDEAEVVRWRDAPAVDEKVEPAGPLFPLEPLSDADQPQDPLEEVILRRGSSRRFSREPISFAQLSTILARATTGFPADFSASDEARLNQAYLIVNHVEGLPSGSYVYHRRMGALELLEEGEFRGQAGHLALGQALGRDASVNVYFLSPLGEVLSRYGNRGYRAGQLQASITAGRMYLAAYAQGLGATGLTFYDDEVTEFFSPHATDKRVMFLIALGVPQSRA